MDYLIVENRQTVLLGPMSWRQRMFQEELNDLEVEYTVPATAQGYLKVNDTLEIFPVELEQQAFDPVFESLSGPFWVYNTTEVDSGMEGIPPSYTGSAFGNYEVYTLEVPQIQTTLVSMTASQRYNKEIAGTTAIIQGQVVTVDTSREGRTIFVQAYSLMADDDTVDWKFPETWLTLTKTELKSVVDVGAAYIQQQFTWEKTVVDKINTATTVDALKQISKDDLDYPKVNKPQELTV